MSRVLLTIPSLLFSIGTTPKSAAFRSTASNTPERLIWGTYSALSPKCFRHARWVKVALGPRNATESGFSRERDAEMISR